MTENGEDIDWSMLEEEEQAEKPKTNYKGWAFRFFFYNLITQVAAYIFIIARPPGLYEPMAYQQRMVLFGIVGLITFTLALIMLILSYTKGETHSLKRGIALFGIIVIGIFQIVSELLTFSSLFIW